MPPTKYMIAALAVVALVNTNTTYSNPGPDKTFFLTADTIPEPPSGEGRIFDKVEIEASFPGGDDAWIKFLQRNLNPEAPLKYKPPAGRYTVIVQFVVDREGKVSNIEALTNHGYGMEEEVLRILKKAPRWTPAIQDGRMVKAYRKQPVTFQIDEEKKKNKRKQDR